MKKARLSKMQVTRLQRDGRAIPTCLAKMPGCKLIHLFDCGGYVGEQLDLFNHKKG